MATHASGLKTHIWNNNLKCLAVLALYPVLIMAMVWAVAAFLGGSALSGGAPYNHFANTGANIYNAHVEGDTPAIATAITVKYAPLIITGVAIWFTIAWFFHTMMIRKLSHSRPVTRSEEPELYNMLENLCISRGMPLPRLEIIESHARNAFASGISTKSFAVTVTRGLMNSLAPDELEGVLAHELTHIQNRDVRLLIITIIFTGMFGFLAQIIWSNIRYGIFYTRGRNDNKGGAVMAMIVIAVVLWLGYLASLVMRFAISRRREYMADAGAIEMTKNPDAMMRALMRISGRDHIPETTADIAMMCIENHVPFMGVFATHPPIEKRIKAISQSTGTPIPESLPSLPPANKQTRFSNKRANPWLIRGRRD